MSYLYGENDPQNQRLKNAEALLEEPDDLFRLGAMSTKNDMQSSYNQGNPAASSFNYGQPAGGGRARTAGLQGPYGGGQGRNYVGSEMGDSDSHSQVQARPRWGDQSNVGGGASAHGGGFNQTNDSGIETIEVGGSRRGRRAAAGTSNPSQGSISDHDRGQTSQTNFMQMERPMTGGKMGNNNFMQFEQGRRPPTGLVGTSSFGVGGDSHDILDQEMSKPNANLYDERKSAMLSDAGSKYEPGDDMLSQYMGQSEFGAGASNIALDMHDHAQRREITGMPPPVEQAGPPPLQKQVSRREQVAQKHGLNMAGSKADRPAASSSLPPRIQTQKSANHGIFLGGAEIDRQQRERGSGAGGGLDRMIRKDTFGARAEAGAPALITAKSSFNPSSRQQDDGHSDNSRISALIVSPEKSEIQNRSSSQPPPKPQQPGGTPLLGNIQLPSAGRHDGSQGAHSSAGGSVSIYQNKKAYLDQKRKEEIERLETDLNKYKDRGKMNEVDYATQLTTYKEKQRQEIENIEKNHNQTLGLLTNEKDNILGTLQESIDREKEKMEEMYQADLLIKEKQNTGSIQQMQEAMKRETKNLNRELEKQEEMWSQLEKIKKQTVDLGEIVQGSMKAREDELRRREIEMAKLETELLEEEQLQIELEEKKLADEERRLQLRKVTLLKLKETQNDDINKMRGSRQSAIDCNGADEERHRLEERTSKQKVAHATKKLELQKDLREKKRHQLEIEVQSKETECINCQKIFVKEKKELEQEFSERHLRKIQATQIEIEERRQNLASNNQELRKDIRILEKKKELVESDEQALEMKEAELREEQAMFEELAQKVQETSERLAEEREVVMGEKATFDIEKERLDKIKHDLEVQKALLQSEFIKAQEFEHELTHRENMLNMLKFHDKKQTQGGIPAYTSCYQLKQQQPAVQLLSEQNSLQAQQEASISLVAASQYQRKFDYKQYMQDLQTRLGYDHWFSNQGQPAQQQREQIQRPGTGQNSIGGGGYPTFDQQPMKQQQMMLHQVNSSGPQQYSMIEEGPLSTDENQEGQEQFRDKFRDKILQKLGNVQLGDDSKDVSGAELEEEDEEEYGQEELQHHQEMMMAHHGAYNDHQFAPAGGLEMLDYGSEQF